MCCRYYLKDAIVGKIYFLLVRIKIKHMELAIIKRETTGSGSNVYNENETITKYEIMDGAPVRGKLTQRETEKQNFREANSVLFFSSCSLAHSYDIQVNQFPFDSFWLALT